MKINKCISYSIIISLIIFFLYFINKKVYAFIFSYQCGFSKDLIDYSKLYNYNLQKNPINLYYINLDSSIERKNRFLDRMNKFNNYNIRRIKAITPNTLSNYNIQSSLLCSTLMTPVEYCCTLSHLTAIEIAYNNNDQYSIIAEDDMIIIKNINWDYLISQLPKDWDIIQLFTNPTFHLNYFKKLNILKKYWLIKTDSIFISAAIYLISRNGMKKLFKKYKYKNNINLYNHNRFCIADNIIYNKLNRYLFNLPLFNTEELDSTISPLYLRARQFFK
jgi:GR25 family glycosyltransferase involved in LPS biosynthesis